MKLTKKAAAIILLVIFMIGNSQAQGKNVKPSDTISMENGAAIVNKSDVELGINDYTSFGQIIVGPSDSIMQHGHWVINHYPVSMLTEVQFYSLGHIFQESLKLNPQFEDVNLIQPGDTVYLSPKYVGGPFEFWIADSIQNLGENDCIWRICERYLKSEIKTTPIAIALIPAATTDNTDEADFFGLLPWWIWLIIALVLAMLIYRLYLEAQKEKAKEKAEFERNPDNFPPMLEGGLSEDPEEAARQLSVIHNIPENNVLSTEQVIICLQPGFPVRDVMMQFPGDERLMPLTPGERYVLAVTRLADNSTEENLHRSHCGNKVGPVISSGHLSLQHDPDGKIILPEGYYLQTVSRYVRPDQSNVVSQNGHPSPEPANQPTTKTDWERMMELKPQNNVESVEFVNDSFAIVINYRKVKENKSKEKAEA